MKKMCAASVAALLIATGSAFAQGEAQGETEMKLSQAECQTIWNRADAAGSGSLSAADADAYVSNFSAADTDGDGSLSNTEFMAACDQGLVQDSSATGAGEGAGGADSPPASSDAPSGY